VGAVTSKNADRLHPPRPEQTTLVLARARRGRKHTGPR
jgi:hypothetical protein